MDSIGLKMFILCKRCPDKSYQSEIHILEMPGIEPGTSYMQSMRSTTELHPHAVRLTKTKFHTSFILSDKLGKPQQ